METILLLTLTFLLLIGSRHLFCYWLDSILVVQW
jgi:hypothetical protein